MRGKPYNTNLAAEYYVLSMLYRFIVLVSFLDKISDSQTVPECWIVPSLNAENLFYINPKRNRQVINRHNIIKRWDKGI